jgi:hypothetical protein
MERSRLRLLERQKRDYIGRLKAFVRHKAGKSLLQMKLADKLKSSLFDIRSKEAFLFNLLLASWARKVRRRDRPIFKLSARTMKRSGWSVFYLTFDLIDLNRKRMLLGRAIKKAKQQLTHEQNTISKRNA